MQAYLLTTLGIFAVATAGRLCQLATGNIQQMTPGMLGWTQAISTGFAAWAMYLLLRGGC